MPQTSPCCRLCGNSRFFASPNTSWSRDLFTKGMLGFNVLYVAISTLFGGGSGSSASARLPLKFRLCSIYKRAYTIAQERTGSYCFPELPYTPGGMLILDALLRAAVWAIHKILQAGFQHTLFARIMWRTLKGVATQGINANRLSLSSKCFLFVLERKRNLRHALSKSYPLVFTNITMFFLFYAQWIAARNSINFCFYPFPSFGWI